MLNETKDKILIVSVYYYNKWRKKMIIFVLNILVLNENEKLKFIQLKKMFEKSFSKKKKKCYTIKILKWPKIYLW